MKTSNIDKIIGAAQHVIIASDSLRSLLQENIDDSHRVDGRKGLMKVPDSVIIAELRHKVAMLEDENSLLKERLEEFESEEHKAMRYTVSTNTRVIELKAMLRAQREEIKSLRKDKNDLIIRLNKTQKQD